jgi:hypothetical protein
VRYDGLRKGQRPCSTSSGYTPETRQVDVHTQHHTDMIARLSPGEAYFAFEDDSGLGSCDHVCSIPEANDLVKALAGTTRFIVWCKGTAED